ncbi:uncharacterized protein LOC134561882 [Prinia subflava]|uniref:uncharacterized protein LOC134561882 n=1 Tax=Prinia subflava TaxID=208062 RepID=UPI002FE2944C
MDQVHRGPGAALSPGQQIMDLFQVAIAFLVGIIIRPAIVALAKGETIDFSMNLKYLGLSFRIGDSDKTSKRKPTPDEEPKKEAISDEESGDENTPGDEPKKETVLYKESGEETTPADESKKEAISHEESGDENAPGDEPQKETNSDEESGDETNPDDKPKDEASPGKEQGEAGGAAAGSGVLLCRAERAQHCSGELCCPCSCPFCPLLFSFSGSKGKAIRAAIGATVGAGVALIGLPVVISAVGFTGAGIAAGSIAAKMMSAAAIANGGGVAAGSTVAVLQSIGAAGFSLGTKIGLTSVLSSAGAASGSWLSKSKKPPSDKPPNKKPPSNKPGMLKIQATNASVKVTQVTNIRSRQLLTMNPREAKQVEHKALPYTMAGAGKPPKTLRALPPLSKALDSLEQ